MRGKILFELRRYGIQYQGTTITHLIRLVSCRDNQRGMLLSLADHKHLDTGRLLYRYKPDGEHWQTCAIDVFFEQIAPDYATKDPQ